MKIAELETLKNWQATAVDNNNGHAIAIVCAPEEGQYYLYDGNLTAATYATPIEHPDRRPTYSIDEIRQMFASRKLSLIRGFMPDST
jgi:hypothetical protein